MNKNNSFNKEYESWTEFLDELKKPTNIRGQSNDPEHGSWYKTKSFSEAKDLLINGWPEGTKSILKLKEKLDLNAFVEKSFAIKYDLIGDYPDPGVYNSGNPECMIDFTYKNNKKGIINIYINSVASSTFSDEDFLRRGASTLCLIDHLENQGYRCGLYTGESLTSYGNTTYEIIAPLKEPNQQIDLSRLAFVTSHPSFLRRIIFYINELSPENIRSTFGFNEYGSYGRPSAFLNISKLPIDLSIPELHSNRQNPFVSDENSEEWIRQQVASFESKITQQADYDEV